MENDTEMLNKIYSCMLDMQKDISDLKQDVAMLKQDVQMLKEDVSMLKQEIVESEERMKLYTDEKLSELKQDMIIRFAKASKDMDDEFIAFKAFFNTKLKTAEERMLKNLNNSIDTLRFVIEDQIDHLEITIKRPNKLSVAEDEAKYKV